MTTVDTRMLEALVRALKFEDDGVAFYDKAMKESRASLVRDIFETLRDEEVKHKTMIGQIHCKVAAGGGFTGPQNAAAPMPDFVSIFRQLGAEPAAGVQASEKAALQFALEVEARGRTMYEELATGAPSQAEKRFYELLGLEERKHVEIIQDSIEYLTDPQAWFRLHEKSGLDGT